VRRPQAPREEASRAEPAAWRARIHAPTPTKSLAGVWVGPLDTYLLRMRACAREDEIGHPGRGIERLRHNSAKRAGSPLRAPRAHESRSVDRNRADISTTVKRETTRYSSRWLTMLITFPSGARTKNLRTPHGSSLSG
jgi:hypothetical protein